MIDSQSDVSRYIRRIAFPVTKEELINGLLAEDAPGDEVSLVERLPKREYATADEVFDDLREISEVHRDEVAAARTYDDYVELVIRHVGDVAHSTKDSYNRVVARIIRIAQEQGKLSPEESRSFEQRLDGAFSDLRGSMSEVTDDAAPVDPRDDLPHMRG